MQLKFAVFTQSVGAVIAGDEVTVYPVIFAPPFDAGALQETVARAFPATAIIEVGLPGRVRGASAAVGSAATVPAPFIATTEKAYGVPLVRPVKVQVNAMTLVHPAGAVTAGDDVTL